MSAETQQVRELQAVVIFISSSSSFEFRARGLCQSFTFHTRKESVSLLLWLRLLVPRGLKLSVFKRRNTSRPKKNLSFSTGPFIPLFYTGESFECRSQTPEKKEERIPKREFLKHKHTRPKSIYFFFFFTLRAQKMHDSPRQAWPVRSRKLRLKMSKCHKTCWEREKEEEKC